MSVNFHDAVLKLVGLNNQFNQSKENSHIEYAATGTGKKKTKCSW